jgi:zinc finger CCHC domain-containing protein 8
MAASLNRIARLTLFSGPQCSLCDVSISQHSGPTTSCPHNPFESLAEGLHLGSEGGAGEGTKDGEQSRYVNPEVTTHDTPQTAALRTQSGEHPGSGAGTLEEEIRLLDTSSPRGGEGGGEGTLGQSGRYESSGHMGEGDNGNIISGRERFSSIPISDIPDQDILIHIENQASIDKDSPVYDRDEDIYFEDRVGFIKNVSQDYRMIPLFHRSTLSALGQTDTHSEEPTQRCFNCGGPNHAVSQCPVPIDHQLVALSRQYHDFFKSHNQRGPLFDLHDLQEQHDYLTQRLSWTEEFKPGEIRGELLREALGLAEEDSGEHVEWLSNMADWGYPKGWTGEEDPMERVRRAIVTQHVDEEDSDEEEFMIFGDIGDEQVTLKSSANISATVDDMEDDHSTKSESTSIITSNRLSPGPVNRWASYPPTYFSPAFLTVYQGGRLSEASTNILRPGSWRIPGGMENQDIMDWIKVMDAVASDGRTFTQDRQTLWDAIIASTSTSGAPPPPPPPDVPPPPPPPDVPPPPPPGSPPPDLLPLPPAYSYALPGRPAMPYAYAPAPRTISHMVPQYTPSWPNTAGYGSYSYYHTLPSHSGSATAVPSTTAPSVHLNASLHSSKTKATTNGMSSLAKHTDQDVESDMDVSDSE